MLIDTHPHKIRLYEGDSKSSRKSAAKFVIVMGNLRSLCILLTNM